MTLTGAAVLRPGDLVRYDGGDHQVIALAGTSESVVLLAYLMASPGSRSSTVRRHHGWNRSGCWKACR